MMLRVVIKMLAETERVALINPPAFLLVGQLFRFWLWLLVIVLLSFGLLILVSFPLFICFLYYYFIFSRRWSAHGYSMKLQHGSTITVWVISVLCAEPLRALIAGLIA
ncbi:hypothetical protein [Paenibacillus hemerocallicola]|uniref:hypothetical protein n=1 Tax=Paenibacillus hemerocallicola TaxID=1172614 RepID=UPI00159EEA6C|nr:hypothetical protein [Paenibacillus hemerocallicola]